MATSFWDDLSAALAGVGVLIGIVSILVGVFALVVALFGLRALIRRFRQSVDVVASWPRATATITEVTRSVLDDSSSVDRGTYEFSTPDGVRFIGHDVEPVVHNPVVGAQLEVAYDPAAPTTSHPTRHIKKRISVWLVLFVFLEIALFSCAFLLFAIGFDAIF